MRFSGPWTTLRDVSSSGQGKHLNKEHCTRPKGGPRNKRRGAENVLGSSIFQSHLGPLEGVHCAWPPAQKGVPEAKGGELEISWDCRKCLRILCED